MKNLFIAGFLIIVSAGIISSACSFSSTTSDAASKAMAIKKSVGQSAKTSSTLSGKRIQKEITIRNFDDLEVSRGININFTQGKFSGKALVDIPVEYEDYLIVKSNGDKLTCTFKQELSNISGSPLINLIAPSLDEITLSSGSSFKAEELHSKELELNLSSGADIKIGTVKGNVEAELRSGSDIEIGTVNGKMDSKLSSGSNGNISKITGETDIELYGGSTLIVGSILQDIELECAGGSNFKCKRTKADKMVAKLVGGSSAKFSGTTVRGVYLQADNGSQMKVTELESLKIVATANSGGQIDLVGSCTSLEIHKSSGGWVNAGNLHREVTR